jgi:Zn-finger nucleic acid-binding protein
MNCPVCQPSAVLECYTLEPHLLAWQCPKCTGHWIRLADYWRWRAQAKVERDTRPDELATAMPAPDAESDTHGLKRCPDCQYILGRFKVGHNVAFALDRCRNCNGSWLDRDEWAALKERGLHDDLHLIFSDEWQKEARVEEQRRVTEARLLRQFGPEDFARAREVKIWLDAHPKRSELLAFLQLQTRFRDSLVGIPTIVPGMSPRRASPRRSETQKPR